MPSVAKEPGYFRNLTTFTPERNLSATSSLSKVSFTLPMQFGDHQPCDHAKGLKVEVHMAVGQWVNSTGCGLSRLLAYAAAAWHTGKDVVKTVSRQIDLLPLMAPACTAGPASL